MPGTFDTHPGPALHTPNTPHESSFDLAAVFTPRLLLDAKNLILRSDSFQLAQGRQEVSGGLKCKVSRL